MNMSLLRSSRNLGLTLATGTALLTTLLASADPTVPSAPLPANPIPPPIAQPAPAGPPSSAQQLVKYRQAVMTILVNNFAPVGDMAAGKTPYDATAARLRADRVAVIATMVPEGFTEATKDEKSRAKAQLWTDRAEFDEHAKDLVTRSEALAKLLKTDQTKSDNFVHAVEAVGGACKDCHDDFRAR